MHVKSITSSPTITDDAGYISAATSVTPTPTSALNVTDTSIEEKIYKGKATPGLRIKGSSKRNETPKTTKKRQFYRDALEPGVPGTSRQVPSSSRIYFP